MAPEPAPPHSGDGHGRREAPQTGSRSNDLPYVTPHMGDGQGAGYGGGDANRRFAPYQEASIATPPWMGDGHGRLPGQSLGPAPEFGYVTSGQPQAPVRHAPMPTPKAEVWKLLTLVLIFVVWISTASALLFLYMDRYLFPG